MTEPLAAPDVFALPEDARWVPLAVLANDAPGLELVGFTAPSHGMVQRLGAKLHYTPDFDYAGADSFTYTVRDRAGVISTATVSLSIVASHEQPQRVVDDRIAAEITPSGRTIELREIASLPPGPAGQPMKAIGLVSLGQRVFVVEQGSSADPAAIHELAPGPGGQRAAQVFFDLDAAVLAATGRGVDYSNAAHGGLRGLAFHPEFARNGLFYTAYMEKWPTDPAGHVYLSDPATPVAADSVLAEWRVDAQGRVEPASHRELFRVGMPVYDHPIKEILFNRHARPGDEDYGLLYIAHGDGSEQSATAGGGLRNDALGKILRIDPVGTAGAPFAIPPGNPFVGDDGMLDAVWSIGHRNPHTLSFARGEGGRVVLIAAEPGRDNFEEINLVEKGGNYGWSDREGPLRHKPGGGGVVGGVESLPADEASGGRTYPAAFLGHQGDDGASFVRQAIAGGFVIANGSSLHGQYVFADFANTGRFYHVGLDRMTAAVTRLDPDDPSRDEPRELSWATPSELTILFDHDGRPGTPPLARASFNEIVGATRSDLRIGEGPDGALWIVNKQNGRVYVATDTQAPDDNPGSIVVRAAATGGPATPPRFSVFADGVLVGRASVAPPQTEAERQADGLAYRTYAFKLDGTQPPSRVEIVYDNNGRDRLTGEDRNLWIDHVVFGGRGYQSEIDGRFTAFSPAPGRDGPRESLFWNGTLAFDAKPPPVLRVFAGGKGDAASPPAFEVLIDGRSVGGAAIAAPQTAADIRREGVKYEAFDFVVDDATPDRIEIVFYNDGISPSGENRDLFLRGIAIDGRSYDAAVDGFFLADSPAQRGFNGPRTAMRWNGAMTFDLDDYPFV